MKIVFKNAAKATGSFRSFNPQAWPSAYPAKPGKDCTNQALIDEANRPLKDDVRAPVAYIFLRPQSYHWNAGDFAELKDNTDLNLAVRVAAAKVLETGVNSFDWVTVSPEFYPGGILNTLDKAKAYLKNLLAMVDPEDGTIYPTRDALTSAIRALKAAQS